MESEAANPFNEFHKSGTQTYFQIADANWGMYHLETFNTEEEARKVIRDVYENRSKNDGHDEYWRNRKQIVIKITTTKEVLG
jgi:hypothetical protein